MQLEVTYQDIQNGIQGKMGWRPIEIAARRAGLGGAVIVEHTLFYSERDIRSVPLPVAAIRHHEQFERGEVDMHPAIIVLDLSKERSQCSIPYVSGSRSITK